MKTLVGLTFHGGVDEIGGNKILLEDRGSRIFLDFGKSYSKERDFFDFPLLQPRQEKHLIATHILPSIQGLYKNDNTTPGISGIPLSHPHGDHWDYIRYVKDEVPIGCVSVCREVIEARERSSKLGPSAEYYVSSLTAKGPATYKKFETFSETKSASFGGLSFEAYPVDHSIPGCVGFILHTSAGNIVYTGDLRFSGPRSNLSMRFKAAAESSEPIALIIEGTNLGEASISSETEVREKTDNIVGNTTGLVMVGCAAADLDRLQTLFEVAKLHGRKIAITMKQAYMIDSLRQAGLSVFDVADNNVLVFQREKKGVYQYEKVIEEKYPNIIDSTDVNVDQTSLLLILGFYEFNELVEIQPKPGSVYILSQSEPFNEEMELQFEKLKRWLGLYGVPLYQAHSSGHAKPQELRRFIADVKPRRTFLIHTDHSELYKAYISDLSTKPTIPVQSSMINL